VAGHNPLEVPAPTTLPDIRVHLFSGFACPICSAFRVLLALLTVYSPYILAGHFSYQQRPWGSPFGVFPCRTVGNARHITCTHMPFWRTGPAARGCAARPGLLGFNPLGSPLLDAGCLALTPARSSHGLRPFQGSCPPTFGPISRPILPRT
jgi:hypothetical protein